MPKTFLLWLFLLAFISPASAADPCKPKPGAALLQPKKGPTGAYEVGVGISPHSLTKFCRVTCTPCKLLTQQNFCKGV